MSRFFLDQLAYLAKPGSVFIADTKLAAHLRAQRIKNLEEVELVADGGLRWQARVEIGDKTTFLLHILQNLPSPAQPKPHVHIALGWMQTERMHWCIEKVCELGASSFTALPLQRSQMRLNPAIIQRRLQHWQSISHAVAAQSGNLYVCKFYALPNLAIWLANLPAAPIRYVLLPEAIQSLVKLVQLKPHDAMVVLSGPEGGFTEAEKQLLHQHQFIEAHLGPYILRAETAPLAALATLMQR